MAQNNTLKTPVTMEPNYGSRHYAPPQQQSISHIQTGIGLNFLARLDQFNILETGPSTRVMKDVNGAVLFSTNESLLSAHLAIASMRFVLTSGEVLLEAYHDASGWKIMSGELMLGTTSISRSGGNIVIPSVSGESLVLVPDPDSAKGTNCCCCFSCCCSSPSPSEYNIVLNGNPVGKIQKTDFSANVLFSANLSVQIKGLIVVGSTMAYNTR